MCKFDTMERLHDEGHMRTIDAQTLSRVDAEIAAVLDQVISLRHEIHKFPELGWQETETARRVKTRLESLGRLTIKDDIAGKGVCAVLDGPKNAPVVALRADMDALPIDEENDVSYRSCHKGIMHACGHDGHTACLWGAAAVLTHLRDVLPVSVKFIFQPAEEGGAGGKALCEAGVLDAPKVDAIFALHGDGAYPCGRIVWRDGPIMAFSDTFEIDVHGKGTHAAWPHLGVDPVFVGSQIVSALQSLASRVINPVDPVVCSVTEFHAGSAHNIIPPLARLRGTLRTLNHQVRESCIEGMRRIIDSTASAHGAKSEFRLIPGYPATINDDRAVRYAAEVAGEAFGSDGVKFETLPRMGAEDFSYYLQKVPGAFLFLGLDDGRAGGYPPLHHPMFNFNDNAIPFAVKILVLLALQYDR